MGEEILNGDSHRTLISHAPAERYRTHASSDVLSNGRVASYASCSYFCSHVHNPLISIILSETGKARAAWTEKDHSEGERCEEAARKMPLGRAAGDPG